jgi:hypothetical protein
MYGKYVSGKETTKAPADPVTANGDSTEASGTDLSSWVNYGDLSAVSFTMADVLAYRNTGASKAVPGFDVLDYGQEDYVFGDKDVDARHWDEVLCKIFEEHADTLAPLFNMSEE